ncbi:ABC transporter permease [Klenkia sp. LSe6-5]|uniref:ABC transporter permease n=1 Tax=Klenkia sesuvii TaxID=3103137 RepID=A0ABU8DRK7_9ACTN
MDWNWAIRNSGRIAELLGTHVLISMVPVVLGLLLAVPLGVACVRWPRVYAPVLAVSTAFFAVPSLALFVLIIPWTGLTVSTAIIPLTVYAVSLLVRNVVDGIRAVDESTRQAATAMGLSTVRRLVTVELPIATPVILGGLRVTSVASIGMVAVVSVIGIPSLGDLFIDGTQRFFATPIIVGIVLTAGLALVIDLLLVVVQRSLTPWARRRPA